LKAIADGRVSLTNEDKINSKATYACNDGFKVIGTIEGWCLRTGNWSSEIPACQGMFSDATYHALYVVLPCICFGPNLYSVISLDDATF
jgi:hypothetical protein